MNRYKNKRLYVDVAEWGYSTRYVKWLLDLLPMVWEIYDLSKFEERIFTYICMQYDNAHESNREPLKLSYKDISEIVKCTYEGAKKAMHNLEDWELITVVGERKGRAKKQYIPNVDFIHDQLRKYLESP